MTNNQNQSPQSPKLRPLYPIIYRDGVDPIPEATPSFNDMQAWSSMLARNKDEIDRFVLHTPTLKACPEIQENYCEQEADWDQVAEMIEGDRYRPESREERDIKLLAWQFGVNVFQQLRLSTQAAYKAMIRWANYYKVKLTQNKVIQILSNARSAIASGKEVPTTLWATDRWIREKNGREYTREYMVKGSEMMMDAVTENGWGSTDEHDKLTLRQLSNWSEGRVRCGNSYWWIQYDSPGLEHLADFGTKVYCKTCHTCGSPGCPECALWETEKETGDWDWEAAFGLQFPVVMEFKVTGPSNPLGPHEMKQAVTRAVKRKVIKDLWDGCFGAFVATQGGYSLQLMMPPSVLNIPGNEQRIKEKWAEVCIQEFETYGQVTVYEPELPAIDCAVELVLKAEREIFRLVAEGGISPKQGWDWFKCWIGSKPGAKGMNRIFHGPGFRRYKLGVVDERAEEIPPNVEDPMLDGNSSEEEEVKPESVFPKTWFSLESQVKKGWMHKIWDPYICQTVYLKLDGQTIGSVPKEYLVEDRSKAFNYSNSDTSTKQHFSDTAMTEPIRNLGLSAEISQTRQAPIWDKSLKGKTVEMIQKDDPTFDPWSTFSPQRRAEEKKARMRATTLEENKTTKTEDLSQFGAMEVNKKLDPESGSSLLSVRLF